MSELNKYIDDFIEEKLLHLHTAYIGRVTNINGDGSYSVQPLTLTRSFGNQAKKQAVINNVHTIDGVAVKGIGVVVLCICCERDISQAVNNVISLPALGHHEMKDSVIVGTINGWNYDNEAYGEAD